MHRFLLLLAIVALLSPSVSLAQSSKTSLRDSSDQTPIYEVEGDIGSLSIPTFTIDEGVYKSVFECGNPGALIIVSSGLTDFPGVIRSGVQAFRVPRDTYDAQVMMTGCNGAWRLQLFDPSESSNESFHTIEARFIIEGRENFTPSPNGVGCAGAGKYVDMFGGLPVSLVDDRGTVVSETMLDSMDRLGDSTCIYFAAVFDVPELDSYQLEFGDFKSDVYSLADMEASDWQIEVELP